MDNKNNLNSKRWFSTVSMIAIYIFLIVKGAVWGFPQSTEQIIWGFIQATLTPVVSGLIVIFVGAETYIKAKNNKP